MLVKMKLKVQKPEDKLLEKKTRPQLSLIGRAIRFLSYREHSIEELKRKLAPHAESEEQINQVIQQLLDKNLLSNERFVESLILRKSNQYGVKRLSQELAMHHIDAETKADFLKPLQSSELERAQALWERKFGVIATEQKEIARQMRYLMSRGFNGELVFRIIKGKHA